MKAESTGLSWVSQRDSCSVRMKAESTGLCWVLQRDSCSVRMKADLKGCQMELQTGINWLSRMLLLLLLLLLSLLKEMVIGLTYMLAALMEPRLKKDKNMLMLLIISRQCSFDKFLPLLDSF
jgi:hypothetical protein